MIIELTEEDGTPIISIELTENQFSLLKQEAAALDITLEELVNKILAEKVAENG